MIALLQERSASANQVRRRSHQRHSARCAAEVVHWQYGLEIILGLAMLAMSFEMTLRDNPCHALPASATVSSMQFRRHTITITTMVFYRVLSV